MSATQQERTYRGCQGAAAAEQGGSSDGSQGTTSAREWLESIPAIAWRTDENARIIERNRHWFEFTGQSAEGATGDDWLEVLHADDIARVASEVQTAVATGGSLDCEFRVRRADGVYRWFLGRALPVRDGHGRVTGWLGIGTDIEDRKRAEQALQDADRRKNEFLGVLGHELRNPLAPILNSIYILDHVDPTGQQARRAREVIARQAAHLGRLVDDLLDVTRIIRGKIELRRARVDLNEIVRRTGEDHRAVMENHGLELVLDLPSRPSLVDGDATRIAQIVGNLLQNSAKFTHQGGHVWLSVAAGPPAFEIHVKDDGTGIAPELLKRMFDPFAQGDQGLARTSGGLGLGLALVKLLAELHGGSVQAFSGGPGQGAEIVVTLPPASPVLPVVSTSRESRPPAGRFLRVLVVEDNRDTADSLALVVQMFGHEAYIARDGEAAIAQAMAHPPDVVLCDIGLPGKNGYEVARELRSFEAGDRMMLVAITGYAQPDDVRAAFDAGFDRHLAKPPNLDDLERLLKRPSLGVESAGV